MTSLRTGQLIRVAVPVPLPETFDYRVPEGLLPRPGARVRVPFGRGEKVGIVTELAASSALEPRKIKRILELIDDEPVLGPELMASLKWAAEYYHHPLGEVLAQALPTRLREGRPATRSPITGLRLTASGRAEDPAAVERRAAKQALALKLLADGERSRAELMAASIGAATLKRLLDLGLIETIAIEPGSPSAPGPARSLEQPPELTPDQERVVDQIRSAGSEFKVHLIDGVTGSGKTEIFLRLIRDALDRDLQTLLLVPEISLTPQLVARLERRFGHDLAVMHSGLGPGDRLRAWQRAKAGEARLIVGTRSAVFTPLPQPGLIIIDEEHDASLKQQTGFRYSARDFAIVRARALNVPLLLASATPSLESWRNATEGRYWHHRLPVRIGGAGKPKFRVVDMNRHSDRQGLSTPLLELLDQHLGHGNQALLFINRRGFAPALFCSECQKTEECDRCDARMTVHARAGRLRCHHCGADKPLRWACPSCGAERIAVGSGTQRITNELQMLYPDYETVRLDRDALTNRDRLTEILARIESGAAKIIVGTQLLVKGHDFPGVTLVGILNADQGLFGVDFRAEERLAQTILQVAGRAGRRELPGEVVVQTHYPDHPLLEHLLHGDYAGFAEQALTERSNTQWPPFTHLAAWRSEAVQRDRVLAFLSRLRLCADGMGLAVHVLGPSMDTIERMSGRYRGKLLFQARDRRALHALIRATLRELKSWPETRRVRWSLDVDPVEL